MCRLTAAAKQALKYMPLFCAAHAADVFGAMGLWNNSLPYMDHEKGLDMGYE